MNTSVTKTLPLKNGIKVTRLEDWTDFSDFITERLDYRGYIWRGQQDITWPLESSFERAISSTDSEQIAATRRAHLKRFQYASRGRRGSNPFPPQNENEWWALGQHHGLRTPLLDWTRSPYVAAYFAFYKESKPNVAERAIFGLAQQSVHIRSRRIVKAAKDSLLSQQIEFVDPLLDDNPRLVSQGGLFTRSPDGVDIETWVKVNFEDHKRVILHKIAIPDTERMTSLRALNRMNINHLTLFPDLYGASSYTNLDLDIENY